MWKFQYIFPERCTFLQYILEVTAKCVGSSFSLFSGKKKCFPHLVALL